MKEEKYVDDVVASSQVVYKDLESALWGTATPTRIMYHSISPEFSLAALSSDMLGLVVREPRTQPSQAITSSWSLFASLVRALPSLAYSRPLVRRVWHESLLLDMKFLR